MEQVRLGWPAALYVLIIIVIIIIISSSFGSANYQSKPLYLLLMSFFDVVILKVWTLLLQMSSHLT